MCERERLCVCVRERQRDRVCTYEKETVRNRGQETGRKTWINRDHKRVTLRERERKRERERNSE